jgi:hypothetical protein
VLKLNLRKTIRNSISASFSGAMAHSGVIPEPRKTAKDLASGEMLPFLGDCLST